MSLRLLVGRAGVGKTHRCLEEIARHVQEGPFGPPLVLLVPEQATFQMEQALVRYGVPGSARARVLSFQRLAHLVFTEVGGAARPRLGEIGRRMLLRSLVYRRRSELQLFRHGAGQAGFIERLAATFRELRVHGYGPDDVRRMADSPQAAAAPVLQRKLRDLAVLYRDYQTYIAGRYADPDAWLAEAAAALPESRILAGARVWVDGFAGFTPQEYRMLQAVLTASAQVTVCLCADPDRFLEAWTAGQQPEEFSLFRLPIETARELAALCRQAGVPVEEPELLRAHPMGRFRKPALAYLEHAWDKPEARPYDGDAAGVVLQSADDRAAEVEAVAAAIRRLVSEEGYRFKEISVVVRDLDVYAARIAAAFAQYEIPHFIDRRRPLLFHPLVQAVTAALEAVAARWQSDPVLRFLKTDLAPVDRDAADRLENYVLEHGITGYAWTDEKPWRFGRRLLHDAEEEPSAAAGDAFMDLDRIRRQAVAPLVALDQAVGRGRTFTPQAAAEALWRLLEDIRAEERLQEWIERAEAEGDTEAASLHVQAWNAMIDLLDQMANVLPQDPMELGELAAMVEEGVQGMRLGLIPPKLDQVLVGAIDRSRHPDVRAVFVLGLVDREFPAVPQEDAVLTDAEREALRAAGFVLGETSRTRMEREHFFAYIAVTRASERLVLSWPRSDGRGKALLPSAVIARVRRIFPQLPVHDAGRLAVHVQDALTPRQAAGRLAYGLRQNPEDPLVRAVYEWFVTRPEYRPAVLPALRSLAYTNAVQPLPPELAQALYGTPLTVSVSRLERFAACPFQHFAAHGLRLRERAVLRLDPVRLGVLVHHVLREYVSRITAAGRDWAEVGDDEALALVDRVTEEAAAELVGEVLLSSARQRYLVDLARRTLRTAVRLLCEHARAGAFKPAATELGFGRPGDRVAGWRFTVAGGVPVQLIGVIDRVDVAVIDGTPYARVVDYKSSRRKIDWSDILQGLELQLLVYLGVAADSHGWSPAGAFYMPVQDPVVDGAPDADDGAAWELRKKALKPDGILVADAEAKIARNMDAAVAAGAASTLFPFGLRKDGAFDARSKVAPEEDLRSLIEQVRLLIAELSERIVGGEHAVRPYRRPNGTRACTYCPYHAVCRFDVLVDGNEYRYLESYGQQELWRRLRAGENRPAATAS